MNTKPIFRNYVAKHNPYKSKILKDKKKEQKLGGKRFRY
jgi:hypothetical protein